MAYIRNLDNVILDNVFLDKMKVRNFIKSDYNNMSYEEVVLLGSFVWSLCKTGTNVVGILEENSIDFGKEIIKLGQSKNLSNFGPTNFQNELDSILDKIEKEDALNSLVAETYYKIATMISSSNKELLDDVFRNYLKSIL